MAQQEDEWFSTWFDSPYCHLLYNNRNLQEAQLRMDRLLALREEDFRAYFNMVRQRLVEVLGDYTLNPFVREESERMIFVLKK